MAVIDNRESDTLLSGTTGRDSIENYWASNVTIDGGAGNDEIFNSRDSDNASISGGAGNDSIWNGGKNSTISGGDGKDTIENSWSDNTSISGGAGNDSIFNNGDNVTISGGADNDFIENNGDNVLFNYKSGDGNDTITGFYETSTLSISGGSYSTTKSGRNVVVKVGNGSITLVDAFLNDDSIKINDSVIALENEVINLSDNGEEIGVSRDFATINGGAGKDSIVGYSNVDYLSISGGAGNDSILNDGKNSTISGGKGNDTIQSWYGDNASISGGDGNDSIENFEGDNVTIVGGKGNDTIQNLYGDNFVFKYADGDGKDKITGFDNTSTLLISGGSYSTTKSGQDVIVKVGNGSITLFDAFLTNNSININDSAIALENKAINLSDDGDEVTVRKDFATINGGAGTDWIYNYGNNSKISGGASNDWIYNREGSNSSISGGAGDDYIDNTRSDNVTIDGGAGDDRIRNEDSNSTISGGAGNDSIFNSGDGYFLFKYKSGDGNDVIVDFNEDSKLSISGGSYSTTQSGQDVVVKVGNGSITLLDAFLTTNSININDSVIALENKAINLSSNGERITVRKNFATINGSAVRDTIYNYGSDSSISGGAGNDDIFNDGDNSTIVGGDGNDEIANDGDNSSINGGAGNDEIKNRQSNNLSISGGTGNDTIYNSCYSENDGSIHYYDDYGKNVLFNYSSGDGNDIIYGFKADSTLSIAGSSYSTKKSGDNVIVTVGDGKISLMGAASLKAINIETETDSTLLSLDNNSKSSVTLGAEIVTADATARTSAIKITGNALDNSILGGSGKDTLYGKDGNDTLWGGKGNDTLSGGNGDDLFVYTAGNDVITDYAEDSDKILISAAISKTSIKGSDATFTIGKNTLTVKDGFGKEIVFIDADGKERTIIGGSYLANDSSSAKSTLSAWREVGDASERTKAIRLTGNALDNSILGGSGKDSLYGDDGDDYLFGGAGADKLYGQNGNDTLWGGIGNDSLKGGDGADVFIYESGDGKDVIFGFENNDMLLITGAFSASYDATKNSIAFKVDSTANAITIKDFTATKFNINGINYKISGSKLVKK